MNPLISIIIPTHNRPLLVTRAVKSALSQSFELIEVVVVIDGTDEETTGVLSQITDPRLRVIELQEQQGAPAARNRGVEEAKADWIALLDDDDEWMPQKLEVQIKAATNSQHPLPIVSSYLIARTPRGDFKWPRRLPRPDEPFGDYLFTRKSLFIGEALILTSTILARKELFQKVPFKTNLRNSQDLDWLIMAGTVSGTGIEFVPEELTIWYREENRKSTSNSYDWMHRFQWAKGVRHLLSPQSYASFILVYVGSDAYLQGDYKAFFPLLSDAFRFGKPTLVPLVFYFSNWVIPQSTRRAVRDLIMRKR